jgi:predicted transcriptional regulator of viral defense system
MSKLSVLPPTFTPAKAIAAGVPRHRVYSWRDEGEIVEISRGVYRKASAPESEHVDLIAASARAPRAVVCLVSALAVHELTDEIPAAVQMALPRGVNVPKIAYPPVEFSRFDATSFDVGRTDFEAAPGEYVPIYSAERTIADVMRLRHLVGDTVAYRALRGYLSRRSARPAELLQVARQLGDSGPLARAVDVVVG